VIQAVASTDYGELNIGMNNIYIGGVSSLNSNILTRILGPGEQVSTHNTTVKNNCC